MDFFTIPTITFGVLYCFFVIGHRSDTNMAEILSKRAVTRQVLSRSFYECVTF